MKKVTAWVLGALCLGLTSHGLAASQSKEISFAELGRAGVLSRTLDTITPVDGCLKTYDLTFPGFERGVINKGPVCNWVAGYSTRATPFGNFGQFKGLTYDKVVDEKFLNAEHVGYYLLLKLRDGRYLAVLPLVSGEIMPTISVYEGVPQLKLCTFGTAAFSGRVPLFSWAFADDPYSATQKCWELALQSEFCKDNIQLRSQKEYPELYEYLGWCTWEEFGGSINEAKVVNAITEIKNGSVPVRWVIVDDGYLDTKKPAADEGAKNHKSQLVSFGTNSKFPNGWQPITSLKEEKSVKWIGIWRNMSGGMGGVSPDHKMPALKDHLMLQRVYRLAHGKAEWEDSMIVKPDTASSQAFYEAMINNTVQSGFDFAKVDFQTYNFWMYSRTGNAVNSAHQNNQALEAACKANNVPLLNCISQSSINVFNTRHSVISRSSVDIKLKIDNMDRTVQSFGNNMWWGDILVGDLDMYHTSNEKTAQYLTVARAISGGPVYVSDGPHHFNEELIRPLIFNDGKIVRALAPAVPLPASLFSNGISGDACYRVIAPTRQRSCSIAAFNFTKQDVLNGEVSKNDYPFAAAKEQPFNGLWAQPEEGLVVYDWEAKQGALLDEDYSYSVDRMKGKIFNLAPVNNGWAVIGRADKYIGGCTFSIARCSEESIELTLDESGPLVVYHKARKPEASEGTVAELGNGFYRIDLPVGELDKKITLSL